MFDWVIDPRKKKERKKALSISPINKVAELLAILLQRLLLHSVLPT